MFEGKEVELCSRFFELDKSARKTFDSVKEELDDHLLAINENTAEMDSIHEKIAGVDAKIDKLNERMDTIHLMFRQLLTQTSVKVELSAEEQRLFVLLANYKNYLRMDDICAKLCHADDETLEHVNSMCDKGIPIIKKEAEGRMLLKLDDEFRSLQQKENLIKISPAIEQQFENRMLNSFFA